ncbi:transglycosylase SLT domain-containing protein [Nocardia brasiliensis]|uniref:transglycosylase SLT domain-containing protein n=1 Tax=Nocardia brasiliensis TaxID=37326 RepID=UPI002455D5D7|nr:transglycosylase SLT domain-containing protein [Nocardia brasiliensis]
MPTRYSAGTAKVQVVPDASDLKKKMEIAVQAAIAGIHAEINLTVEADTAAARTEIKGLNGERVTVEVETDRNDLRRAAKDVRDNLDRASRVAPTTDRDAARRAGRIAGEQFARGRAEGNDRATQRLGKREGLVVKDLARYSRLDTNQKRLAERLRAAARQVDEDKAALGQQGSFTRQARARVDNVRQLMNRANRVSGDTPALQKVLQGAVKASRGTELEKQLRSAYRAALNDEFNAVKNRADSYSRKLSARARTRKLKELQQALTNTEHGGPIGSMVGRTSQRFRERLPAVLRRAEAAYQRAQDNEATMRRRAERSEALLRGSRKAFRQSKPDARDEKSVVESRVNQLLSRNNATTRIRGKAERLLVGRDMGKLLQADQRAITNAHRSATQLDTAERTFTKTRMAFESATTAVNMAEQRHGELLRNSATDAKEVERSERALFLLRQRRSSAAADLNHARSNRSHALARSRRDEDALDTRVAMPMHRRLFQNIDERSTRALAAFTEKLLLSGRLLTATTQVAVGAGAALAALGAVNLVPLIGSLLQAGSALAVLPALAATAAAGIAAIIVGSTGVVAAFKAATELTKNAGKDGEADAKARESAAKRVAQAQRSVEDAYRSAARSATQGQESIANGERNLGRAQRNAIDAQKSLNQARKDAATRIRDVNDALRGTATSEKQAYLATLRARQNLADAFKDGDASGLDIQELQVAITAADENYDEVKRRNAQLREEAADTNRKGIEGDEGVVRAKQSVTDAIESQAEAQRDLQRTVRDAAEANADAQRRIADALDDQGEALRASTEDVSTWERKYQEALANLSPNARRFVEDVRAMGGSWRDLRMQVQDGLFEGLSDDIRVLGERQLPVVKDGLTGIATGINGGLRAAIRYLSTDLAKTNLEGFFVNAGRASVQAGEAIEPLTRAVLNLSNTGSAFAPKLFGGLTEAVQKFDTKIAAMRADGSLARMIDNGIEKTKQLGRVIRDSFGVLREVFRATSTDGNNMLDSLERKMANLRTKLASESGQDSIRKFFEGARLAWDRLYPVLANIARIFTESVLPAFQAVGAPILTMIGLIAEVIAGIERWIPLFETLIKLILTIKAFNFLVGLVGGIAQGFSNASRHVDNFNTRVSGLQNRNGGLTRMSTAAAGIGAAIGNWASYIAVAALAFSYFASKAEEVEQKIKKSADVFKDYQTSEPEFRRELTASLNDSDGVADQNVRAKIGNRFQERIEGFKNIDDEKFKGWAMSGIPGTDIGVSEREVANAGARRDFAANAVNSWEKLKIGYGDVADAIVGTNAQYDALIARVKATGQEGDDLLVVLQYLRSEYNTSVASASRMSSAYESIRKNSVGAADAVDKLTQAFQQQRRDAKILEDAEQSANSALDSIEELVKGPVLSDSGAPLWLASLIKADGEIKTLDKSGRDLRSQLDEMSTSFARVGAAAFESAKQAGKSDADAHAARIKAMQDLQDRLRQMFVDADVPKEKIDALLASFKLIPEALADPPKFDINTQPAQDKLGALAKQAEDLATKSPTWFGPDADPMGAKLTQTDRDQIGTVNSGTTEQVTDRRPFLNSKLPSIKTMNRDDLIDARIQAIQWLAKNPNGHNRFQVVGDLAAFNRALGVDPNYLGGIYKEQNLPASPTLPGTQTTQPPATPPPGPAAPPEGQTSPPANGQQPPAATPPQGEVPASQSENKPPAQPKLDLPDFTNATTSFNGFADAIEKAYDKQILPALTGIADKAAAMAKAIVDANALSGPAITELGLSAAGLNVTFAEQIEKGAVPAFQKLRPAMGLDIADITVDMLPKLTKAITDLAANFQAGVGAAGFQWSGMRRAVADPINWIITNVINKGLKDAWAALRQVMPDLPEWKTEVPLITGYSSGGLIPGYRPGHDNQTILVGPGEAIMRPEWVRAVGPSYIHGANAAAREGGIGGVRRYQDGLQHYATGGITPGGIVATSDPIDPVQRSLWDAVRAAFPKAILNSAKRFQEVGAGYDYHMQGKAIDLGGPMQEIARWIYSRYPQSTELIHWPLAGWQNLKNGQPTNYGEPTNSQHRDHLHWANLGQILSDGRMISLAAGSGNYLSGLQQQVQELLVNPMLDLRGNIPDTGASLFGGILPKNLGQQVIDSVIQSVQSSPVMAAFQGAWDLSGGVEQWRPLVEKILKEKGQNPAETNRVLMQMKSESGGNPRAINLWDSNAKAGIPSKGLMQVIDPTFQTYKDPGYEDIWDPESNIRAAINYALRDPKYGSLAAAFQGKGYDRGGWLPHGGIGFNTSGKPELVLTNEQTQRLSKLVKALANAAQLAVPDLDPTNPQSVFDTVTKILPQVENLVRKLMARVKEAEQGGRTEETPEPGSANAGTNDTPPASTDPAVATEPESPDTSVNPDDFTDTPVPPSDRYGPGDPPLEQPMSPEQFGATFGPKAMGIVGDFFQAQWDGFRGDLGLRDAGFFSQIAKNHNALREGGQQIQKVIEQHVHYHVSNLDEAIRKEQLRQRQQAAGYIRR